MNTYHSKLQGIHAVLMAILAICSFHDVTDGEVMVCCDNEKALWLSGQKEMQVSMYCKHADLICAIWKLVIEIPIEVVFEDAISTIYMLSRIWTQHHSLMCLPITRLSIT